ncbi:hypothetical protein KIPB_000673 [Kipferlia bialata]|uniref:Uncharacterized protein n=1 Tax=Kipferlia bialata TaxID=797122 RepID=A0A9K3CPK8_9EUKA|nr:hypothetical protein KIPB_000673 [Kipferlia bialata]|eukprot:g673.t1
MGTPPSPHMQQGPWERPKPVTGRQTRMRWTTDMNIALYHVLREQGLENMTPSSVFNMMRKGWPGLKYCHVTTRLQGVCKRVRQLSGLKTRGSVTLRNSDLPDSCEFMLYRRQLNDPATKEKIERAARLGIPPGAHSTPLLEVSSDDPTEDSAQPAEPPKAGGESPSPRLKPIVLRPLTVTAVTETQAWGGRGSADLDRQQQVLDDWTARLDVIPGEKPKHVLSIHLPPQMRTAVEEQEDEEEKRQDEESTTISLSPDEVSSAGEEKEIQPEAADAEAVPDPGVETTPPAPVMEPVQRVPTVVTEDGEMVSPIQERVTAAPPLPSLSPVIPYQPRPVEVAPASPTPDTEEPESTPEVSTDLADTQPLAGSPVAETDTGTVPTYTGPADIASLCDWLATGGDTLEECATLIQAQTTDLAAARETGETREAQERQSAELTERERAVREKESLLQERETLVRMRFTQAIDKGKRVKEREAAVSEREALVDTKERALEERELALERRREEAKGMDALRVKLAAKGKRIKDLQVRVEHLTQSLDVSQTALQREQKMSEALWAEKTERESKWEESSASGSPGDRTTGYTQESLESLESLPE